MSRTTYEFGGFRLDSAARRLLALGTSSAVDLPPRALDALLHLVERSGELLTKAELMKALWPSVVVEENSLNQVISVLRRALGEKPSEHRYIVTAPGRGYRFVAAVRVVGEETPDAAEAADRSIAILPFVDLTSSSDKSYLGDAIAVDLIRALSARSRIRVAAHTSSFAFRGTPVDCRSIASTLAVRRLLEGHVEQRGSQYVVSCRLIDGRTGLQTWSAEFSRDTRDLAALQAELAHAVHGALDPDARGPAAPRLPEDPDAWRDYLKALSHSMKPSPGSIATSIALLQAAVARDAQFARARSLLAIQYTTCVMFGFPLPDALDLARREVAAALELDDQNGETHCAAAVIDCLGGAWCRAEERFRIAHALSADPLISGLRCAYLLLSVGHLRRAEQQAEYAVRVAPTHPIGVQMLAMLNQALGRDDAARRYAELALDLGVARTVAPMGDLFAQLALRAGDRVAAATYLAEVLPARVRQAEGAAAVDALLAGDGPEALIALEAALTPAELDPPMRKRLILWLTCVGALDAAFDLASRSLDHYARESTVGGAWGVLWVPEMAAFRADPRFDLFARRLRLHEYWSDYGFPAFG